MPTPELRADARRKFDRHPAYVWIHASLWFVALGMLLAPTPVGVLATLSSGFVYAVAACLGTGSTMCLCGIAIGTRRVRRDTIERPLDLRVPYLIGLWGMLPMAFSMSVWGGATLFNSDIVGTLAGFLTIGLAGMFVHLAWRFSEEIRKRVAMRTLVEGEIQRYEDAKDAEEEA